MKEYDANKESDEIPSGSESAWAKREEEAFIKEIARQKMLGEHCDAAKSMESIIQPKSEEEIFKMNEAEYKLYAVAMRDRKRRLHLQKRVDPIATEAKSGGFQRIE